MQGMPISSVAPRGCFAGGATSRIVSAELLRFRDSRSVDALLEETTLACFSWETGVGFGFALIVPTALSSLFSWERDCPFTFGNGVDDLDGKAGMLDTDRAVDLRVAVDLVDVVERTDAVEAVRFATGPVREVSAGFPLSEGVVLEATDGGRLGMRGVLAPVV